MQSEYETARADRVQISIIPQILKPLPDLFLTPLTQLLDFNNLILDILFEPLQSDSSLCRMISIEYLSLKLLLGEVCTANALAEPFELAVRQLSVEQHVKLPEYLLDRRLQILVYLLL